MAKKSASSLFDVSDLNSFMSSEVNKKGGLIDEIEQATTEYISSGIYALDALLSGRVLDGGITNDRFIGIGGESGTGKTFLALNFCRAAQKQGYFIIYIDSEGNIKSETTTAFGIDSKMFRLDKIRIVEDFKVYMAKLIEKLEAVKAAGKELPKMLIVLDSLGNLASRKEVADAQDGEHKADMTRAKQLKSIFRIITAQLAELSIPLLATNHTYMTQEMYPKEVFSGGTGAIYNASTILILSKAKLKSGEEDELDLGQSGIIVTAKTQKNRMAKPKKVRFEISFVSGANPYKGLEYWCTEENFKRIGVAKGKMVVDKGTGEEYFQGGGNNWYVRHLGKSVPGKHLHTAQVFNQEVLEAMHPVLHEYFRYSSAQEQQEANAAHEALRDQLDEAAGGIDADDLNADDLFGV
jgi:RecA/RadA recombinase